MRIGRTWVLVAGVLLAAGCGGGGGAEDAIDGDPGAVSDADVMGTKDTTVVLDPGTSGETTSDPGVVADIPKPASPNYFIVTADAALEGAVALKAYRESTGYSVALYTVSELVPDLDDVDALIGAVHEVLDAAVEKTGGAPLYLALIGDPPGSYTPLAGRVPVSTCKNELGKCFTDNRYGDLDGDNLPDVAVGRLSTNDPAKVKAYVEKLATHESTYEPGEWNRRVLLYTGEAGFGPDIDALLEMAVMKGLARVSYDFDLLGTYANKTSYYYYTPYEDKVVELVNDGNLLLVYIGHGSDGSSSGIGPSEIPQVHCKHRLPVATLFACYTGNFVSSVDSLAEGLLWKADGPIGVFASTDVSHPYGNAVLAYEAQRVFMDLRPQTVGEALNKVKRESIVHVDDFREFVDGAATLQVPTSEQILVKAQHLDLYNLLGDPAARIVYPKAAATVGLTGGSFASGNLSVAGTAPGIASGTAHVTVEIARDTILREDELTPVDAKHPDPTTVQKNWAIAMDRILAEATVDVKDGKYAADLSWTGMPPSASYYVKVYASDTTNDAYGSMMIPQ